MTFPFSFLLFHLLISFCAPFLPNFPFHLHPTAPISLPALPLPSPTSQHGSGSINLHPRPHGTQLCHGSAHSCTPPWGTHSLPLAPMPAAATMPPHLRGAVPTPAAGWSLHPPCVPPWRRTHAGSPHAAARRHPGSARPPPGAGLLCTAGEATRTSAIYTWLKQIPRWLRSFPCILFSLPGLGGHFPFPPAFPLRSLPVRLISLSWPCSPTPRRSLPTAAPSRSPRAPVQPLALPALTALPPLCSLNWPLPSCKVSVASGGQLKRQSAKGWGASAAKLDKILEKIQSEKSRALVPARACDGIENPLYASVRTTKGKKGNCDMMRQQRGRMWD